MRQAALECKCIEQTVDQAGKSTLVVQEPQEIPKRASLDALFGSYPESASPYERCHSVKSMSLNPTEAARQG